MPKETAIEGAKLDGLLGAYRTALAEWVEAIRMEMDLAASHHNITEVDQWEHSCDAEEDARSKAISLRGQYESALRREFYHF